LPEKTPQNLWETALGQLELQVTRPNFETWLRHTVGLGYENDALVVGVQSDFAVEWLQRSSVSSLINRTVSRLLSREQAVSFQVLGAPALRAEPNGNGHSSERPKARPELMARLTFESFTVTKCNRLAYRAAQRVATGDSPYNPLVIHGAPGLGKTHLLHSVGHAALARGSVVVALTAEAFVDRYGKAVRAGEPQTFRELFRSCAFLLLDDVTFLASREGSQQQFLHLFDALQSAGCQIVVTTPLPPDEIEGLSAALRSRLQAGLAAELHRPSDDDRLRILKDKASRLTRELSAAILHVIAAQPYNSIRDLEGALNRADAFVDLSGEGFSQDALEHALYPFRQRSERPSAERILDAVSKHFNVDGGQIAGKSRARDIAYARHLAAYLMREITAAPLAQIGTLLGGRDHSTILHACRRIDRERASLPQTQHDIDSVSQLLGVRDESVA
jgi:chromosomal replication initiator protein